MCLCALWWVHESDVESAAFLHHRSISGPHVVLGHSVVSRLHACSVPNALKL